MSIIQHCFKKVVLHHPKKARFHGTSQSPCRGFREPRNLPKLPVKLFMFIWGGKGCIIFISCQKGISDSKPPRRFRITESPCFLSMASAVLMTQPVPTSGHLPKIKINIKTKATFFIAYLYQWGQANCCKSTPTSQELNTIGFFFLAHCPVESNWLTGSFPVMNQRPRICHPFGSSLLSALFILLQTWEEQRGSRIGVSPDQACKWCPRLPFTFHQPEPSHVTTSNCKGTWKMWSSPKGISGCGEQTAISATPVKKRKKKLVHLIVR